MPIKPAKEPLLAPGRHLMSLGELRRLTVTEFPNSQIRPTLFAELERLYDDLRMVGISCELWIDGSFLTKKEEPKDIDLCFACYADEFDKLDLGSQSAIFANLNGGNAYSPHLDTYVCFRFDREDPRIKADRSDYWSEKWGIGWDNYLTGFAVLPLGATDVRIKLST